MLHLKPGNDGSIGPIILHCSTFLEAEFKRKLDAKERAERQQRSHMITASSRQE